MAIRETENMRTLGICAITFLAFCAMVACPLLAADWPNFMGPNANGIAPDKGINKSWSSKPPKKLWEVPMGDDGYAGPSVAAGKLYIVDHEGSQDIVKCLDFATGKQVWAYAYDEASRSNYGFAKTTPAVSGGYVYTISRQGILLCIDTKTGKPVWWRNIVNDFGGRKPGWDYSQSPLVDGNKLIICPGGPTASVVALDKKSGKIIWQSGDDAPSYATPVKAKISGITQYLVFSASGLHGYDTGSGKHLWHVPWKTSHNVHAAVPIPIGNSVYISSGYGVGCGLVEVGKTEAKVKWSSKAIPAHFSSAIYSGGHIYGTGDPGNLVCLDPTDGSVKWTHDGFEKGGICGVDGVILALDGKSGALVMVKMTPEKYVELGRFTPLGGQSWTAPIVADGRLVVRNKTALACFDLK